MTLQTELSLTERQKQILGAVVDLYVKTAQPVGSKAVVSEYRLNISPATVRLEFKALGEMGLIFQPHTSAGRVPSNYGYRVFVDKVMRVQPVPPHKLRIWEKKLTNRDNEIEDLLKSACRLLSQCTKYASLMILPCRETEVIRGINFTVLPDRRVVAMILGHRLIYKVFPVAETFEPNRWQQAANWLSFRLNRVPLSTLIRTDWSHWETADIPRDPILPVAFKLVQRLAKESQRHKVWVEGLSWLLNEPELKNLEWARKLISLWETPQKLTGLWDTVVGKIASPSKAWVAIGSEIPFGELQNCSIVAALCFAGDSPLALIGVLGPKRMRYPTAIPTVESIASLVSRALTSMLS